MQRSNACCVRTKFIVFLGTPHRGSSYAGWGEIASNLAMLALLDSNKKIIETLEINSEVLDNIHEQFKTIADQHRIKIYSFQEAQGISGMKGLHHKVGWAVPCIFIFYGFMHANQTMMAGSRRLFLETRSANITRDSREHGCKSHADG